MPTGVLGPLWQWGGLPKTVMARPGHVLGKVRQTPGLPTKLLAPGRQPENLPKGMLAWAGHVLGRARQAPDVPRPKWDFRYLPKA